MKKEILIELLENAKLSEATDMNDNAVIDIEIEENGYGVYALCMCKNGDISFYTEYKPMHPNWFEINLKDIATKDELPKLYEALKTIQ